MATEQNDQGLIKELMRQLDKKRKEYEKSKVKCGIMGQSGTGKTSLVMALTGRKDLEVGIVETTGEPIEIHDKKSGVIFVDLPGSGTKKWPNSTYVNKLKLSSYDCLILVTAERFLKSDILLYKNINSKLQRPCYIIRNKIDRAIEDGKRDNNLKEKEVCAQIEANIRENLSPVQVERVYLTSARYPNKYDLPALVTDISSALTGIKKQRFIADMAILNRDTLIKKRAVAEHLVGIYAGLAAGNAINPIPGLDVSVDMALLLKLSRKIVNIYGLSKDQIDNSVKYAPKAETQALKQWSLQITAKYLTKETILLLLKKFGKRVAIKEASKYIPIIGQAVAAALAYRLTYHFGETLIDDCETAAQEILDSMLN